MPASPDALYRPALGLLTDLYQLTMAAGYRASGIAEREAVFHLTFRQAPFEGRYVLACGLEAAAGYLESLHFPDDDVAWLATLEGPDRRPLFDDSFLQMLSDFSFACDVHALPEGSVAFPHVPLMRVRGPLWQAQIVETALLNLMGFASLVATKAARICDVAGGPVVEFGLRRAQGPDGGLTASRAAWVGGCAGTSNVLAGRLFGIPVKGTHAHSWVLAFEDEAEAFAAWVDAYPGNSILLVDTHDTRKGVRKAVTTARLMDGRGERLGGVRLDSGDLAALARDAREQLDDAGFEDAVIVASNDLDEYRIEALRHRRAPITLWGVGSRLVTAADQPSLGVVYKLGAIRAADGSWRRVMKRTSDATKATLPGALEVERWRGPLGEPVALALRDADEAPGEGAWWDRAHEAESPLTPAARELALIPIFEGGRCVWTAPPLWEVRVRARDELRLLPAEVRRLRDGQPYPVLLSPNLQRRRQSLSQGPL
jgi:nicotinate phosphoribosyltransferase